MLLTTTLGDRLRLLPQPVLRGGESCVYQALDATGRALAVKVALLPLPGGAWLDEERRVLEEVAADPVVRPHVVAVRHHGRWGDRPFIAMDWHEHTLASFVPGTSAAPRFAVAQALCRAVAALHAARPRLVHRDLKPTNVLLDGAALRLADFGTAREPRPGHTTTTQAFFTPGWAPPEQSLPLPNRPERSWDVYALAATLFFTLVGAPPEAPAHNARCLTADGVRLLAGVPTDLAGPPSRWLDLDAMVALTAGDVARLRAAGVARAVEDALRRALAPRPEERRGTAGTLGAALSGLSAPSRAPRRRVVVPAGVTLLGVATVGAALAPPRGPSGYETVRVEPGHYVRGTAAEGDPVLPTTIVRPFRIGVAEVSQRQWVEVTGEDPGERRAVRHGTLGDRCLDYDDLPLLGDDLPMHCLSFLDVVRFANALSVRDGLTPAYAFPERSGIGPPEVRWDREADGWRLPTEEEWEYVARAGHTGTWPPLDLGALCAVANLADLAFAGRFSLGAVPPIDCDDGHVGLAPVLEFPPNAFGVRSALGNVSEWVWTEPGPDGDRRVRGASWSVTSVDGRLYDHGWLPPDERFVTLGVRLARNER